jgi:hypothetical protein
MTRVRVSSVTRFDEVLNRGTIGLHFRLESAPCAQSIMIPDSVTNIGHNTFYGSTLLETNAIAAGLSIEQLGRSNWRKWKRIETRFVIASTVKKLNRHTNDELNLLVVADGSSPEVGRVLRFMIECGEEGLMRMIVGCAVGETEVMIASNT